MYTVEIAGRPIAIMNCSKDEAEEEFSGEAFKSELLALKAADGGFLWNGKDRLFIRRSLVLSRLVV